MSIRTSHALPLVTLCLALFGCGDRVGKLIAQLESGPDAAARRAAARALGEQKPITDRAVMALAKAVGDTHTDVRLAAITTLSEMGPAAESSLPTLRHALADDNEALRLKVALAIGHIDPDDTSFRPVLIAALREGDGQTMLAVGGMGQNAAWAVPTLVGLLSHREAKVRALAAHMLGRIGPAASEAKGTLQQLLRDSNAAVCDAAQHALDDIAKKPADDDG